MFWDMECWNGGGGGGGSWYVDSYSLGVTVGCSGSWCVDSYSLGVNVEICAVSVLVCCLL